MGWLLTFGLGATSPDQVAINLGTSGALRVIAAAGSPIPPGLWCYRVDDGRELIGGALSNGGNLLQWAHGTLKLPDREAAEAALAAMPAGQHGLTVLPYWAGERSPGYADYARAAISGMTLHTTPLHILQAILESVAHSFATLHSCLLPVLPPEHRVFASGGAIERSPVWQQMLCDALGRPLVIGAAAEATARGAAVFAAQVTWLRRTVPTHCHGHPSARPGPPRPVPNGPGSCRCFAPGGACAPAVTIARPAAPIPQGLWSSAIIRAEIGTLSVCSEELCVFTTAAHLQSVWPASHANCRNLE
jgi:hypothetical protein